jgi:hypothetical protein
MIEAAETSGDLGHDKAILEATSGNTYIGLALAVSIKAIRFSPLALMAVVMVLLARKAFADYRAIIIGLSACLLMFRNAVNTPWLVLGGLISGIIIQMTRLHQWLRL